MFSHTNFETHGETNVAGAHLQILRVCLQCEDMNQYFGAELFCA